MLSMQLQIGLCDAVRVSHVVVDGCSGQAVRAASVFLSPADRGIDRDVRDVDALRHQFPRHALREPGLGLTCHREGAARGKPLSAALAFVKMIVPLAPLALGALSCMMAGRLLPNQKGAER